VKITEKEVRNVAKNSTRLTCSPWRKSYMMPAKTALCARIKNAPAWEMSWR
jgi:hypothetical protein